MGDRACEPSDRPGEREDIRDGVQVPEAVRRGDARGLRPEEQPGADQTSDEPAEGADVFPELEKEKRMTNPERTT
jgi:hypothetical protein